MQVSRRVEALAWALSLGLHAALAGYVVWSTTAPDLGFDFELPMEVEFGLTDAVTVSAGAAAPPPDPATPADEGEGPGASLDGGVPVDAGPPDAGRRRRDAGPPEAVAAADEGDGTGDEEGEGRGVAFLPAGAQIALRLDVERIRRSPLGPDVQALLAAMPDWQALLAGSEIDPLQDLDRLLVATPNLQRSRLIVAGRVTAGADTIRAAAERLAAGAGQTLTWRTEHGVDVAAWHNRDETERVVAIIGPRHFVICRPVDLGPVMAVARIRADEEEGAEHPADALLSMEAGEGLSLEIEGAREFARARGQTRGPIEMVPTELRLALSELPADAVAARSRWTYEDGDRASAAAGYWDGMRVAYGRNVIAAVLGVGPILQRATIEAEDDHFEGNVDLQVTEMRRLLALTRGFFEDRARAQQRDAAPPEGEAPTAPAPPANPYE